MAILKTLTINDTTYDVTPVVPASSVTLLAAAWEGSGEVYSQVVKIHGVTAHTKVDLQPTSEQLAEFHYLTLGFVAENDGGTVTVYAIGDKPAKDHIIQITKTEVEGVGRIRGNTVGTTMPKANLAQDDPTKADYVFGKEEFLAQMGGGGAGVHVGPDTPPDTATVWIDPSGEPTSTEDWEFDMEDGTTETRTVVVVS